jgi:hypothetical protein
VCVCVRACVFWTHDNTHERGWIRLWYFEGNKWNQIILSIFGIENWIWYFRFIPCQRSRIKAVIMVRTAVIWYLYTFHTIDIHDHTSSYYASPNIHDIRVSFLVIVTNLLGVPHVSRNCLISLKSPERNCKMFAKQEILKVSIVFNTGIRRKVILCVYPCPCVIRVPLPIIIFDLHRSLIVWCHPMSSRLQQNSK